MPVNATHPEYDANLSAWSRARDVIAGEDAVKSAGERYLPRLESQTDEEYDAYRARASFYNATARTADAFLGLVFRRPPFVKLPEKLCAIGKGLAEFCNDADMLGTPLASYAKNVVKEVVVVGRAGTLVDWEGENENRVYVSLYAVENILNWRVERINGRNVLTLVVLYEPTGGKVEPAQGEEDFGSKTREQIRVLKLVAGEMNSENKRMSYSCQVDLWQRVEKKSKREQREWKLVETRIPLRLGKPLPLVPFVFHSPRHFMPEVEKLPLADVIGVNLDHYRLDADYKHGMHFTALPTAWVSGFDKSSTLRIGSSTAWVTETPGATAGFLEYTGQGLTTFERAMDRDEGLMAVLGARLLESQKKVVRQQAIELRQSGENTATSPTVTETPGAYWWNSASPDDVTKSNHMELNTDFSTKASAQPPLCMAERRPEPRFHKTLPGGRTAMKPTSGPRNSSSGFCKIFVRVGASACVISVCGCVSESPLASGTSRSA